MGERQILPASSPHGSHKQRSKGTRRAQQAGRLTNRPRPKARPRRALVPLYVNGVPRGRVSVASGSLVEIAVHDLGARLIAVDEEPASPPDAG